MEKCVESVLRMYVYNKMLQMYTPPYDSHNSLTCFVKVYRAINL